MNVKSFSNSSQMQFKNLKVIITSCSKVLVIRISSSSLSRVWASRSLASRSAEKKTKLKQCKANFHCWHCCPELEGMIPNFALSTTDSKVETWCSALSSAQAQPRISSPNGHQKSHLPSLAMTTRDFRWLCYTGCKKQPSQMKSSLTISGEFQQQKKCKHPANEDSKPREN